MQNGGMFPQAAVFDIETQSAKRLDDDLLKEMDRLLVRWIPEFILAYLEHGAFRNVKVQDVWRDMAAWEREHVRKIDKLTVLLERIATRARSKSYERWELSCRSPGILEIHHVRSAFETTLPDALGRFSFRRGPTGRGFRCRGQRGFWI